MTKSVKVESIQHPFDPRLQIGKGNHPATHKGWGGRFEDYGNHLSLRFNNEVWCPTLQRVMGEDGEKVIGNTWRPALSVSSYYNKYGKYPDIALVIAGSVIDNHISWQKINKIQPHLKMTSYGQLEFNGRPKHFSPIGVTHLVNKHIDELIDPFFWQPKGNGSFMWNEATFVLTPKEFKTAKTGII